TSPQEKISTAASRSSGQVWMARCDSAMTTTPLMPNGLNSWKTTSTMVACARLAASTMDVFTVSRLLSASASQSNSSSSRCRPSACTLFFPSPFLFFDRKISARSFFNVWPPKRHCKKKMNFFALRRRRSGVLPGAGSGRKTAARADERQSAGTGAPISGSMRGVRTDLLTFDHARKLAKRHGTPLLALSRSVLRESFHSLQTSLPNVTLYYAIKANPHAEVLRLLHAEGSHFDVSSIEEIRLAQGAGATPDHLLYTKPFNKPEELRFAFEAGLRWFVVENEAEV